jgi:hypothetical protein
MIELTENITFLPYGRADAVDLALGFVLIDKWPETFGFPPKPLALGIDQDILAALSPPHLPAVLRPLSRRQLAETLSRVLGKMANRPIYVKMCQLGEPRISLHGQELGWVTKDEADFCQDKFTQAFRRKLATGAGHAEMVDWMRSGDCRV